MSVVTYQAEKLLDCWREALPLVLGHFEEISDLNGVEFDPDWDGYLAREAAGRLRCYTARLDGALVGYAVFGIGPHRLARQILSATQDVLYMAPEHRGKAGVQLITFAINSLRAENAKVVYLCASRRNRLGRLFEALGFTFIEGTYAVQF